MATPLWIRQRRPAGRGTTMQPSRDPQVECSTDPADLVLEVAVFSCLTDTTPRRRRVRWTDLADDLLRHDERESKDGPG